MHERRPQRLFRQARHAGKALNFVLIHGFPPHLRRNYPYNWRRERALSAMLP